MKIGEFVTLLHTTKDTVRHYEELNLLTPAWSNNYREYGEKEISDFGVIIELKEYGLSLKDIQILFDLKRAFHCGDQNFITQVYDKLTAHVNDLRQQEEELHSRRIKLENELTAIRGLIPYSLNSGPDNEGKS
ncbi:MerR family transcriptional regulator [Fontibacillus sp. BL9]|uniref:MerR family transcriptional regulator n=1 Tax=Fontibacillus sp. BL9 TaxID=3389971 RepID=UPI00397954BC